LKSPAREIAEELLAKEAPTRRDLERAKFRVARSRGLPGLPSNADVLRCLSPEERARLGPLLRRKRVRAASGVTVVAVMTAPRPCPHGRCVYCPGGPEEGTPQSYTGHEPAALRGFQSGYDGYAQVRSRVGQLEAIGHRVDKVDLIVMGGTFPSAPWEEQRGFVKECLDAVTLVPSSSLEEAKRLAESSRVRVVGITFETRPETLSPGGVDRLLELGATRVEIGVQNPSDEIYRLVKRGHTVEDVVRGTRVARDSGLKICYHMMPGLPGSSLDEDYQAFSKVFEDPRFRPDMLKIYPTLVVKGTELYDWWKRGEYQPLSVEEAVDLLARVKSRLPPWVRVMRVQRDIPAHQITAGIKKGNLRQLVQEEMGRRGLECKCIRCREVGHRAMRGVEVDVESLGLNRIVYEASGGVEVFLSVEDRRGTLVGFTRLRVPGEPHRREITAHTGIIRELHVYGEMTPVGEKPLDWQHQGWGKRLMAEAERVAREEFDLRKMVVMSALGTKEYYRGLGYQRDGVYVSKPLD